jgi:hypothetical protein
MHYGAGHADPSSWVTSMRRMSGMVFPPVVPLIDGSVPGGAPKGRRRVRGAGGAAFRKRQGRPCS